eukprot:TRINITY_DN4696_c0_g1_i1.p1 TRINITY_DN4696_c0_g1~~TRINITY_DN4696_c0_g1_i1.p1  ORF type:complete len:316 (-),score=28.88 TRINITY_DN4696_c0_g1_i1:53-1000(-)
MLSKSTAIALLGLLFSLLTAPALSKLVSPKPDPIIGLVAQPLEWNDEHSTPYVAASYVKWLESAGARVVVLQYKMTKDELAHILPHLDGVLFPGGDLTILEKHQLYRTFVNNVVTFAENVNTSGGYFALWGTCMGYESIAVGLTHMNTSVLGSYDSWDETLSLTLMDTFETSMIGQHMDSMTHEVIQNEKLFFNNHRGGIHPSTFITNTELRAILTPLTTNEDSNGVTFVSMYEGINRPYWGSQYHPEKIAFEWTTPDHLNQSAIAVQINQFLAKFFVDMARHGSAHHSAAVSALYIWNFSPKYDANEFTQVYYF